MYARSHHQAARPGRTETAVELVERVAMLQIESLMQLVSGRDTARHLVAAMTRIH